MTGNKTQNSSIQYPEYKREDYVHRVVNDAIQMMARKVLRLAQFNQQISSQLFSELFKRATGQALSELLDASVQNNSFHEQGQLQQNQSEERSREHKKQIADKLRCVVEQMIQNAFSQELDNAAKNMEIALLRAAGACNEQITDRIQKRYGSAGISSYEQDDANLVHNFWLHKHKIQRYLRSAFDGAMQPAMRQALRAVSGNATSNFQLQQDKTLASTLSNVSTGLAVQAAKVGEQKKERRSYSI